MIRTFVIPAAQSGSHRFRYGIDNPASDRLRTEGKQRSSLNALKTGLTGRTVLMPGEDAEAYRLHCQRFEEDFQPATTEEEELVQSLADMKWRLIRSAQLEHNLFALGRVEFAHCSG